MRVYVPYEPRNNQESFVRNIVKPLQPDLEILGGSQELFTVQKGAINYNSKYKLYPEFPFFY